jgi:chemotaxis protein histidine kinase CheA
LQRKVDIKKLDDFHNVVKEEFIKNKTLIRKMKGNSQMIQNDCLTYMLRTGGKLTRNLFRKVRRPRLQNRLGSISNTFPWFYVQGFLPKRHSTPVLPNHKH